MLIDKFEEKMLAESLGALWGWLSLFIPALNPFKPMISISIAFGVNSKAYGDNSKGYGFNSASLGDRNHSFKKA